MSQSRRVVITGFGLITPIGSDTDSFWGALLEGRSGVHTIRSFDPSALPTRFAAEVPGFDARQHVEKNQRKSLLMMARPIQLGVAGAQLALGHGRVDKTKLDPTRFGVEFGAGLIASELPELADAARASVNCRPGSVDMERWGDAGIKAIQPKWMLKYLPNMPACHISILHNAQGPNNSITESDAASLLALGEAFRILKRDDADFFLVGGAESKVNPVSLVRQCLFEQMSKRNEEPEKACRPFDSSRDGLVLGEGTGVLVVEDLEHARKRGAEIYAEVIGFGAAFDRKLNGEGLARAIRAALADAGVGPEDIDHVNAHGLGTRHSDVWEARGIASVFGTSVPVFGAKGYLGNLGAASGTAELVASILGLRHGVMPATLNHDEKDPQCPVTVIAGSPRQTSRPCAVKIAFTQMGQCAAVVVRKWQ
jgi:3-oxoacyl-[acyl-carrier-protein] synthase II